MKRLGEPKYIFLILQVSWWHMKPMIKHRVGRVTIVFILKILVFFNTFFWDFLKRFFEIFLLIFEICFFKFLFGLVWFNCIQSVNLLLCLELIKKFSVVGGRMKATLVFIFGPNLKSKTLLRPRPMLNKIQKKIFIKTYQTSVGL